MSNSHASKIIPGIDIVSVTPAATALPNGPCKALWIGTAGTINITTVGGGTRDGVPAKVGVLPVQCTHVRTGGTASDIWAIY